MSTKNMAFSLPQELLDAVIDELALSSTDLKTCALVDSGWTRRCQQHLFRHLELDHTARVSRLRELISSQPSITSYVKAVTLFASSGLDLSSTLALLPDVRKLGAEKLVMEPDILTSLERGSRMLAPSVTELCLNHCTFMSVDVLQAVLAGFPNLRTLSLLYMTVNGGGANMKPAVEEATPATTKRLKLQELRIQVPYVRDDDAEAVGAVLGQSIESVRDLHITLNRECCVTLLQVCLEYVGCSVEHLNLDVNSYRGNAGNMLKQLDMTLLTNLVSLSIAASPTLSPGFDSHSTPTWEDYITPFLTSLCLNMLRRIDIQFHLWLLDLLVLRAIQWKRLDNVLATSPFNALKHLRITIQTRTTSEPDIQARIRALIHAHAETLDERDILRVEFCQPAACS